MSLKKDIIELDVYSLIEQQEMYNNKIQCIYANCIDSNLVKYYNKYETPYKAVVVELQEHSKTKLFGLTTFTLDSNEDAGDHDNTTIATFISENGDGLVMCYYDGNIPSDKIEVSITKFDALLYNVIS